MKRRLVPLALAALTAGGCNEIDSKTGGSISYALPVVPIQIEYKYPPSEFTVSIAEQWTTPLGTIGVAYEDQMAEKAEHEGYKVLFVEYGDIATQYKLQRGIRYDIKIPNDKYGKSTIIMGETTIRVKIPNPTDKTPAELMDEIARREQQNKVLRDQLDFERESRKRAADQTALNYGVGQPIESSRPTGDDSIGYFDCAGRRLETHSQCNCPDCESTRLRYGMPNRV